MPDSLPIVHLVLSRGQRFLHQPGRQCETSVREAEGAMAGHGRPNGFIELLCLSTPVLFGIGGRGIADEGAQARGKRLRQRQKDDRTMLGRVMLLS